MKLGIGERSIPSILGEYPYYTVNLAGGFHGLSKSKAAKVLKRDFRIEKNTVVYLYTGRRDWNQGMTLKKFVEILRPMVDGIKHLSPFFIVHYLCTKSMSFE